MKRNMFCDRCGSEMNSAAIYCPKCGKKRIQENSVVTVKLKCNECGGIMSVDGDRSVLSCPYCGSKEMLRESDAVAIERIKSQTQKEIALAQMYHSDEVEFKKCDIEERRFAIEQKRFEMEEKNKLEEEHKRYKKSWSSKILLAYMFLCLISTISAIDDFSILAGLVGITQIILFSMSWLKGMGYMREKRLGERVLFATIGYGLTILFLYLVS